MNAENALKSARKAAQEARQVLLGHYGRLSKVREKGLEGLVSEADEESEAIITAILTKDFPGIPILGEEGVATGAYEIPDTVWIVDPLDGTTNYVHGFPVFCISIGLRYQGRLEVGVVDVPMLGDTYWGHRGGGAFLNGEKLRISSRTQIKEALLATGFYPHANFSEQIQIFSELVRDVRGVRRAGAAAYDLCLVAQGVFDGFWERNLKPWDAAAAVCLIREAGGQVIDYQGREFDVGMDSLMAAGPELLSQLLTRLQGASRRSGSQT